jgi:hypothetical protein
MSGRKSLKETNQATPDQPGNSYAVAKAALAEM